MAEEGRGQAQPLAPFVPRACESLGRTLRPGGAVLGTASGLGIRWYLKAERDAQNHAFALAESGSGKHFRDSPGSVVWGPGRGALGRPLWELPPSQAPPACVWGGGHTTLAMFWVLDILLSVQWRLLVV